MARGVDDVDAVFDSVALPEGGGSRGRDSDAAFALLLHPVHRGGAVVHFAELVRHTRVKQDALGARRLSGVDVRHDPDVPGVLELCLPSHFDFLRLGCRTHAVPPRSYHR
jgi:hypothetical protein